MKEMAETRCLLPCPEPCSFRNCMNACLHNATDDHDRHYCKLHDYLYKTDGTEDEKFDDTYQQQLLPELVGSSSDDEQAQAKILSDRVPTL